MGGEDGVQMFMGRSVRDLGRKGASRREIRRCVPDIVLGITAGETATVLTVSCRRFEVVVLVLAGFVSLALVLLRILFLPSPK